MAYRIRNGRHQKLIFTSGVGSDGRTIESRESWIDVGRAPVYCELSLFGDTCGGFVSEFTEKCVRCGRTRSTDDNALPQQAV